MANKKDAYLNFDYRSANLLQPDDIDKLGKKMLDFTRANDEVMSINTVIAHFGISVFTHYNWIKAHTEYSDMHAACLQVLAARREERALKRDPNGRAFYQMQHQYDTKWKEAEEYHFRMREKESMLHAPRIVEIPVFMDQRDKALTEDGDDDQAEERNALPR